MGDEHYFTYYYGRWMEFTPGFIFEELDDDIIYSARISTGLFGTTRCPAGNRGPKDKNEVILAAGNQGLVRLIEMGFIPCDVCEPEFDWTSIEDTVTELYNIESEEDFRDKDIVPYDARRLDWEAITTITKGLPGRIYLPEGLKKKEVKKFARRLKPHPLPELGYYDQDSEERFTQY